MCSRMAGIQSIQEGEHGGEGALQEREGEGGCMTETAMASTGRHTDHGGSQNDITP